METLMRRGAIKWTYLTVLVAFLGWFASWLSSGYLFPRGEGMVIGAPAVVAAEFNATIQKIFVQQGQAVSQGEVVAHITSQYMAESRAKLTAEAVQRSAKLAEMRIRKEVIKATLAPAETRERVASEGQARLKYALRKRLLAEHHSHRGRGTSVPWQARC